HRIFFDDQATTEIYTLFPTRRSSDLTTPWTIPGNRAIAFSRRIPYGRYRVRSEEHTSELQSLAYLVCRLRPEKKKSGRKGISGGGCSPSMPRRTTSTGRRCRSTWSTRSRALPIPPSFFF